MQLGFNSIGGNSVAEIVADARQAEAEGFATYSMANIFGLDAINTLSVVGSHTSRIKLLTAVVPTYPRHPAAMAQQALTAASASDGRFTLGIGLSHAVVIHGMFGYSFDRPARHMRDYLAILLPLLRGEAVRVEGGDLTFRGQLGVPRVAPVPCAIAAMGPAMLRVAGEQTEGTILWMTTAEAIRKHIVPRLRAAAASVGRTDPQVIVSLPIALTSDVAGAREAAASQFQVYGNLPSYRAMLDASGLDGPADAAMVGDEATLERGLRELQEAGVTQFNASCYAADPGAIERTRAYLASLASA
jgi:F420-dependent oxidoreductase-like protein